MFQTRFLNHKILNPNILSNFSRNKISKTVMLIGQNDNKMKNNIFNQILKYNIKKTNIIKIKFFKELLNV